MPDKEYDYLVTLKSNTALISGWISNLLLLIAFVLIGYFSILLFKSAMSISVILFIVNAVLLAVLLYNYISRKKSYFNFALMLAGICFVSGVYKNALPSAFTWLGFLYIIAGLLEKQARFPQELGFDKDGITTNSIVSKHFNWNELTNAVIKDNLLTLDFKNNKLFQKELQNSVSKEIETEFNHFCKNCLSQNG